METKKISMYIEGLDEVLGGGFPVGHVVLLSGLPETMKSTLSYAILHRNAKERGARCLYVSFEQTLKRPVPVFRMASRPRCDDPRARGGRERGPVPRARGAPAAAR